MPELPEMETYRALLEPRIAGKRITGAEVTREKSINVPVPVFINETVGQTVVRIERRAKHLLFHLSSTRVLLLHLMLGGSMFLGMREQEPDRTKQVVLEFGGLRLCFIGLRLGYLHLHDRADAEKLLEKLGPEPLAPSFDREQFHRLLKQKRGSLKAALVDQSFLSGIGNCYSDEICFHAGLRPARTIAGLSGDETAQLFASMQAVLTEAARGGGYMDMPLFPGDTLTGSYDSKCAVYDREGEPCFRCGGPIVREDVASKKSFHCLRCQR